MAAHGRPYRRSPAVRYTMIYVKSAWRTSASILS